MAHFLGPAMAGRGVLWHGAIVDAQAPARARSVDLTIRLSASLVLTLVKQACLV